MERIRDTGRGRIPFEKSLVGLLPFEFNQRTMLSGGEAVAHLRHSIVLGGEFLFQSRQQFQRLLTLCPGHWSGLVKQQNFARVQCFGQNFQIATARGVEDNLAGLFKCGHALPVLFAVENDTQPL